MNEYELIGRLADLDSRLKKLEGVEPIQGQPQPTPSLIEVCERFLMDYYQGAYPMMRDSLAREKRIAEKRDNLLAELRHHAQFSTWDENQVTDILECLRELDKEAAK